MEDQPVTKRPSGQKAGDGRARAPRLNRVHLGSKFASTAAADFRFFRQQQGPGAGLKERIDISGGRHLPPEAVSALVTAFLKARPDAFSRWIELERAGRGLESIREEVENFLKDHCIYDSGADLRRAAQAMRGGFRGMAPGRQRPV